tara:strand:+ start:248 stop:571 length:324 start_codon:yes stop_codon:yes gene_type:complete
MNNNQENQFYILRNISKNPNYTQREMAKDLGFSLGKLNYCLQELKKKGLIKINNFKKNPKKIGYLYILTPKGFSTKTKMTLNFMQKIMKEYDQLKKDIDALENVKKN